jgi:hypothetical protein
MRTVLWFMCTFFKELVDVQAIFFCHLKGSDTKKTHSNKIGHNTHTQASCVYNFSGLHRSYQSDRLLGSDAIGLCIGTFQKDALPPAS